MNLSIFDIVNGNGKWKIQFDEKSNQWVGYCDQWGLTASGLTQDELYLSIHEAITLVMHDILCSGVEL